MNEGTFQKLGEVLASPGEFAWTEWLFLPANVESCAESTRTFAIDDSAMEDDLPHEADEAELTLSLSMQTVQDVVAAWEGQSDADTEIGDLVDALAYYAQHDAFKPAQST